MEGSLGSGEMDGASGSLLSASRASGASCGALVGFTAWVTFPTRKPAIAAVDRIRECCSAGVMNFEPTDLTRKNVASQPATGTRCRVGQVRQGRVFVSFTVTAFLVGFCRLPSARRRARSRRPCLFESLRFGTDSPRCHSGTGNCNRESIFAPRAGRSLHNWQQCSSKLAEFGHMPPDDGDDGRQGSCFAFPSGRMKACHRANVEAALGG